MIFKEKEKFKKPLKEEKEVNKNKGIKL